MTLSIIIPVRDENKVIKKTIINLNKHLSNKINLEILVIDDFSKDNTYNLVKSLNFDNVFIYKNKKKGIAHAIKIGIKKASKDYTCIYMSDESDSINDIKKYLKIMKMSNIDAVFGSRFIGGSRIKNYPKFKLFLNRIFNILVKLIFLSNYNDFTNAFKIYKTVLLKKIIINHSISFDIFLEIPLKFINNNYSFHILPISWTQRKKNLSKFKIKEVGSKYFKVLVYCFMEKIGLLK